MKNNLIDFIFIGFLALIIIAVLGINIYFWVEIISILKTLVSHI